MSKLFVNVEFYKVKTRINVAGFEDLRKVRRSIKAKYGPVMADIDAPQLEIYDKENRNIDTWKKFIELEDTLRKMTYSGPMEANAVVQLPENVFILGNDSIGSSIFIRPCYPKLFQTSLSIVQSADIRHLIILGNPGIGKTYFGYFLLLQLARSKATVVYERGSEKSRYLFTNDQILQGKDDDFRAYLEEPTTFYIADACKPVTVPAKTILLSSLRKEIWYQFSKTLCCLRFMPVWSREELLTCRSMLYPSIPEHVVDGLYLKWGGIARYVLQYALIQEQQALLIEALDISNIDAVVQSLGGIGEKAEVLIHRSVDDDFRGGPYQCASAYVVDENYKRVYALNREHLIRFMSISYGVELTGQLRGILFERHSHAILARGGTFKIRNLQTNEESTLQIPANLTTFMYKTNDAEFQTATDCYFCPVGKIFESVIHSSNQIYSFKLHVPKIILANRLGLVMC